MMPNRLHDSWISHSRDSCRSQQGGKVAFEASTRVSSFDPTGSEGGTLPPGRS